MRLLVFAVVILASPPLIVFEQRVREKLIRSKVGTTCPDFKTDFERSGKGLMKP